MAEKEDLKTYSEHGEDLFIWHLFKTLGFNRFSYLDLGANHPEYISNTKLFYDQGCRGINVEPNRYLHELLCKGRPEDINICCGVGPKEGHANFYIYDELSTCNTFSLPSKLRLQKENGHFGHDRLESVLVVYVNRLIKLHCKGNWPEFLNCDIEGYEYLVLETASFAKSAPIVICVQVDRDNAKAMTSMLWQKGFCPYAQTGDNVIYVRNDYWEILLRELGIW